MRNAYGLLAWMSPLAADGNTTPRFALRIIQRGDIPCPVTHKQSLLLIILALLALVWSPAAAATEELIGFTGGRRRRGRGEKKVKVGFLYVGSVDDAGYNQAAYQGQLTVSKMANVETVKAKNVPENAEAERVMEQMISRARRSSSPPATATSTRR
jgi:hypothetical protein